MFGALLGALFGGYLVDKIGRYKMFMADMALFVGTAIACAFAWNAESLTFFRFLMGIGIGLDFPVALAFIAEYTARKGKGGNVTLWQPMWYVATASSFAVLLPLYFLIPESGHENLWRWAVGFGAVPALAVLLVRKRYMEESASWLANQGDLEGAVQVLRNSYGADVVLAPEEELERIEPIQHSAMAGFKKLLSPKYRLRTIQAGIVGACQSMQYYSVAFYLPFIIVTFMSLDRLSSITVPLLFNIVFGISGGFAGVFLIRKWGSRFLALSGFVVCFITMVLIGFIGEPTGIEMGLLTGALLGVFVFSHSYGPGAQGMTMATLSYPTSLRGTGAGFGQAILRVGSTISLLLFPVLARSLGTDVFFVVAIAPAVGIVTLLLIRWDPTKVDVDQEDYEQTTSHPSPQLERKTV
jgi:MFS family permease